jgi:hypothetical protein
MSRPGQKRRRGERRGRKRAEARGRPVPRRSWATLLHPSTLRWLGQSMSHRFRRGLSGGLNWIRTLPPVVAIAGPKQEPQRPKKTLILHIGMGKTGTTAIQNALWDNREVLAQCGITYPTVGTVAKAHHLVTPRCPPFLAHTGWRFLEVAEWAPILAETATTETIVMSSELIVWSEPEQVAAFCAALKEHFHLKACLYLRRQDNGIMAGYNQMIKAGTQTHTIDKVIERQLDRYDYLQKIWPWEKALGAENLIVLPYERGQFHKGDLIDDFLLKVLGIERPEGFEVAADRNANPRLSRAAMEYKRCINNLIREPGSSERFNPVIARYSEGTDADSGAIFHEHDLLTHEQRTQVMQVFEPGNAYIARKFMGREDGALFLDTEIPKARRKAAEADLGAEFRALSETIAREEPELFAELRVVVEAALASPDSPAVEKAATDLRSSFGELGASPAEPAPAEPQQPAA